jgi:hypothetical protein
MENRTQGPTNHDRTVPHPFASPLANGWESTTLDNPVHQKRAPRGPAVRDVKISTSMDAPS